MMAQNIRKKVFRALAWLLLAAVGVSAVIVFVGLWATEEAVSRGRRTGAANAYRLAIYRAILLEGAILTGTAHVPEFVQDRHTLRKCGVAELRNMRKKMIPPGPLDCVVEFDFSDSLGPKSIHCEKFDKVHCLVIRIADELLFDTEVGPVIEKALQKPCDFLPSATSLGAAPADADSVANLVYVARVRDFALVDQF